MDTVITRGTAALREKPIILIWSLWSLRLLLDILVGYVILKHESDLGYKVRNPQHTEDNRCMQVSKKDSTGKKQQSIAYKRRWPQR